MSYEEKGAWVYLVATVLSYATYVSIILGRAQGGVALTEVPYASTMLWTIAAVILTSIVARVLVEIATPSESYKIDARDKAIDRFGQYVGGTVLSVLMLVPLCLALAEFDQFWIANAIYAAFVVSALVGTPIKLIAYRRGL